MYERQQILIKYLTWSRRPLSLEELQRKTFLLWHEQLRDLGTRFYAYAPTESGPESFTLSHELKQLANKKIIHGDESGFTHASRDEGKPLPLDRRVQSAIERSFWRYATYDCADLLRAISEQYPDQVTAQHRRVDGDPTQILTIGYEKSFVEELLQALTTNGVRCLIDVRRNPTSRRYGFHKRTLRDLAQAFDISYYHFPDVGISSDRRTGVHSACDMSELLREYEATTLPLLTKTLEEIAGLCQRKRCALMCSELDPTYCHRTPLANKLKAITNLQVKHLAPAK